LRNVKDVLKRKSIECTDMTTLTKTKLTAWIFKICATKVEYASMKNGKANFCYLVTVTTKTSKEAYKRLNVIYEDNAEVTFHGIKKRTPPLFTTGPP